MKKLVQGWRVIALPSLIGILSAAANAITITTPFMNLENDGINSDGFSTGQFLRIGANSVTPSVGTVGLGTTVNLVTGQTVTRSIFLNSSPLAPDMFQRKLTDNGALYGPWTLGFTNGTASAQATVMLPAGATQTPFVSTITLSGTSDQPTFTWTPPAGTPVDGYRINIFDKSVINLNTANGPINDGQVVGTNVRPNVTSYTVRAGDFTVAGNGFQLNHDYSIEIGLIQTKDGTSNNLGNGNLKAISRVYADFNAHIGGGPTVNLPVTLANGAFQFNMAVTPGQTYYIDPTVATGYDYRIGNGNPDFASVVLPTGIGDGKYDIFGFDTAGDSVPLAHDWLGGTVFDFSGSGVDHFRVSGIETSAGLDPTSTTAFVTGLTFEGAGLFTGTQTPIVSDVAAAVPEPQSYALLLAGLGIVAAAGRRRRQ